MEVNMVNLGIIGFGGRVSGLLPIFESLKQTKVSAIADPRGEAIRQSMPAPDGVRFYTDADQMLTNEDLAGVIIGTRGCLHVEMAKKVMALNLPLYLEKPVATDLPSLLELRQAAAASRSPVVVSFPLRLTQHCQLAKQIIDSGQIGTVEHVQAVNNVPYGGVYYHHWYRDEAQDGGIWLAKTTHDFDYITYLIGQQPEWVFASESKQIFKGSHPAGLACKDCPEWFTCPESPYNQFLAGEIDSSDHPAWEPYLCSFATDTGNHDSASAIIGYANGMHAVYSQNFYARKGAARRGAILIGYKGTLEFDWYSGELKVSMHHTSRTEKHQITAGIGGHGGGDMELVKNFVAVMQGQAESLSPLSDGLLSAMLCMLAKQSCREGVKKAVVW
jgi:predicted dehydrogenase